MSIEEKLKRLAVRIEQEDGTILGSGVLWQPYNINNCIYVFTAAHVIYDIESKEIKKNLIIKYLNEKEEGEEFFIKNENNIAIHENYNKEDNKESNNDIAIIKLEGIKLEIESYKFKKFKNKDYHNNSNCILRGFPKCMNCDSLILSGKTFSGDKIEIDTARNKFNYTFSESIHIDNTNRNDEFAGISGSGVFFHDDKNIYLLGIHSYGVGIESAFATVVAMLSSIIIELCEYKKWHIPEFDSDINGDLLDCIKYFGEEISNEDIRNSMFNIIKEDFSKAIDCSFCGNSQQCDKQIKKYNCDTFRSNFLIIMSLLAHLDNNFDKNNLEKYPIKLVCSEGVNIKSRVRIQNFIHSLKTDYLTKNTIKNNSLIIWISEKAIKSNLSCNEQEFKNIVSDIKNGLDIETRFNIKSGMSQPTELSIMHIDKIKNKIEENLDEVKENLSNYIKIKEAEKN